MSYSDSRARYAEILDAVANDHEEVVITRAGHEPVVIVSLEDYQSLQETAYLLRSPENARRLVTTVERLDRPHRTASEPRYASPEVSPTGQATPVPPRPQYPRGFFEALRYCWW
jgi:antitoxin YefM